MERTAYAQQLVTRARRARTSAVPGLSMVSRSETQLMSARDRSSRPLDKVPRPLDRFRVLQKGFGLHDVDRKLPVTADTLFSIGSSTKSFTAMAAVISQVLGNTLRITKT